MFVFRRGHGWRLTSKTSCSCSCSCRKHGPSSAEQKLECPAQRRADISKLASPQHLVHPSSFPHYCGQATHHVAGAVSRANDLDLAMKSANTRTRPGPGRLATGRITPARLGQGPCQARLLHLHSKQKLSHPAEAVGGSMPPSSVRGRRCAGHYLYGAWASAQDGEAQAERQVADPS